MRINVFEFEDFKWFPDFLRRGMMDYLRYFFTITNYYAPTAPLIEDCLDFINTDKIIDLCSGGGGPALQLQKILSNKFRRQTDLSLTDLYPNRDGCRYNKKQSFGPVRCIEKPIDATAVPASLNGLRTLFSSIHHFNPEAVSDILSDAVRCNQGIAIFDIGNKNILTIVGILIFHPILLILLTPFFRPFRLETILFTYIIPLIPFFTVWDGVMSILRLYSPSDLKGIADKVVSEDYQWRSGKVSNMLGLQVTYLIGVPSKQK
jgi:hypothetical protein